MRTEVVKRNHTVTLDRKGSTGDGVITIKRDYGISVVRLLFTGDELDSLKSIFDSF